MEKVRDPSVDPARATFETSVVSRISIPQGTTIERAMVTTKRPGSGIPVIRIDDVIGRRAARAIGANELLEAADLA